MEKLDFILEVLNQENFLNSYEKEISKENFSLYPNISDNKASFSKDKQSARRF